MMWKIGGPLGEEDGMLYWDGRPVSEIAESFGTPTYVYSEERIRENYRKLRDAFSEHYAKFRISYAVKANSNMSVLNILRDEGAGADCAAPAELSMAEMAGFDRKDMLYTGNYNSDKDFRYAIDMGVTLNLDDITHIGRVARIKKQESASLRINPGIGRGEFSQITTGGPDAKFGIPFEKAAEAYAELKRSGVEKFGMHMMTGSNILDPEYFGQITARLLDIAGDISKKTGIEFSFIDIGGGFGVPYRPGEQELDIERVGRTVSDIFKDKCREYSLGSPELRIEPGRYLVGDAGILLARVTSIKTSERKFVGCDAGMNTLLRPALYGAYHHILVDGKADTGNAEMQHKMPVEKVSVCGRVCENTDQFAKERELPAGIREEDLLVFLNCGAYGFVMSSQYNSMPRPAEVLTSRKSMELIRKREGLQEFLSGQIIPERFGIAKK